VPGYEVVRRLHEGGQGVVYVAVQQSTRRKVALKVMHGRPDPSDLTAKRFDREVEIVAQFNHPNIVRVFDGGRTEDGRLYCVMEYVRGRTLTNYIREEKLSLDEALHLFLDVIAAVGHAHKHGVVHRDLKPANILVDHDGVVRVVDFGLAKAVGPASDLGVSQTGEFLGTLRYTSPEQLRAQSDGVDVRADVYSLGVILYEILTGVSPYPEKQYASDWVRLVLEAEPTPPRAAWDSRFGVLADESSRGSSRLSCPIDRDLETIVLTALAKSCDRRYQDAAALGEDVRRYLHDEPIAARRDSLAYVLQSKTRRWIARHQFTASLAMIAIAVLLAAYPVSWFVYRGTDINDWYEGALAAAFPMPFPGSAFEHVRIIAFDENTDFEALAKREGVTGVDPTNARSFRRMHGRFITKLAESKCRTLMFDIKFPAPTEFDDGFVEGVRVLRAKGIDVTVGTERWWLDEPITEFVSTNLLPYVRYGCTVVRLRDTPYAAQLAAQRGVTDPHPSLALATYGAYKHPDHQVKLLVDDTQERVNLIPYKQNAAAPAEKVFGKPDQIPLTRATLGTVDQGRFKDAFGPEWGLKKTDLLAFLNFDIPSDAYLAKSTVRYEDVFEATPASLRKWFEGKAIVVADRRHLPEPFGYLDRYELPDGRLMSGCYAHASVLDQLIRREFVRMLRPSYELLLLIASAAIGAAAAAVPFVRGLKIRVAVAAVVVFVVAGASVFAYARWHVLFNSMVPGVCLLIAFVLCAWSTRVRRIHGTV